jgi:hypothetical protein
MIVCQRCGFQNESGDTFCGSCAAYLEWSTERAEPVAVGAATGAGAGAGSLRLPVAPPPDARRQAEAEAEEADRIERAAREAAEAAAQAKAEAEARAQVEAEARAQAEADAQAKAELDRQAQADLKRRAEEGAEARLRAEVTAKRVRTTAEKAKAEAALQARREAETRIRQEAEARARATAEAKARAETEARGRAEAEARAKREAERQRQLEAEAREVAEAAEARAVEARAAMLVAPVPAPTDSTAGQTAPGGDATGTDSPAAEVDLTEPAGAAGVEAAARHPEAMQPAPPRPRSAAVKAPPSREPQLGDLICEQCTEGNVRIRKFCRRCGASLFEAKPFVPPEIAAGDRPMLRGGSGPTRGADPLGKAIKIGTAALAALVVLALLGPVRAPVGRFLSGLVRTPEFVQVRPVNAEGSSIGDEHKALFAIDRDINTYWSEGLSGTGSGAELTITFPSAVRLDRIGIYSGANDTDFETQPRPREIRLTFLHGGEKTTQSLAALDDVPAEQFRRIRVKHPVTTLVLNIKSVYPALGNAGSNASISGLEFFYED